MSSLRILATTNDAVGHFLPMAPTLAALAAAGHEVRVGCPERFAAFVRRCGFTPIACPETAVEPDVVPPPPVADRAGRLAWAVLTSWPADCRSWVDALLPAAAAWRPDVVLVEPVEHAGRVVAAALDLPFAVHGWGSTLPAGTHERAAHGLADLYAAVGAAPRPPRLVADLGPARLHPPDAEPVSRFGYVPWPVPGEDLPPRTGAPRVLITLGTYPNPRAAAAIRAAARATRDQGVEVVVVLGHADRGAADDELDGVVTVTWTDLTAAVASSDLVVHHGGAGTTWTSLVQGRPSVLIPHGADQFVIAARVEAAGAGLVVAGLDAVAPAVRTALDDPRFGRAAQRVAEANALLPPPAALATSVAGLAQ